MWKNRWKIIEYVTELITIYITSGCKQTNHKKMNIFITTSISTKLPPAENFSSQLIQEKFAKIVNYLSIIKIEMS